MEEVTVMVDMNNSVYETPLLLMDVMLLYVINQWEDVVMALLKYTVYAVSTASEYILL